MTNFRNALVLVLATFTATVSTGCADLSGDGSDFGLAQDLAFGETGDEWGAEAGQEAGEQEGGDTPLEPGFDQPVLTCGDGIIQGREECDDGELNGITEGCTPECMFNVCGDGFQLVGIEDCDMGDLNGVEQDGSLCTQTCEVVAPE